MKPKCPSINVGNHTNKQVEHNEIAKICKKGPCALHLEVKKWFYFKKADFWGAVLYRTTTWANTPEQGIPSKPKCVEFTHSLAEASTLQLPTTSPHGVIWRTKKRIDKPLLSFQVKSSIHSATVEKWRCNSTHVGVIFPCNSASLRIVDGTVNFLWTSVVSCQTKTLNLDGWNRLWILPRLLVLCPVQHLPAQGSTLTELHSETSSTLVAYVRLSLLPSTATANCRFLTLESLDCAVKILELCGEGQEIQKKESCHSCQI